MRLAIMQPYLFPYIGYFQLINAVDIFVFYDDVNFIKGGWINRNRVLINGDPVYFSVPLDKQSSFTPINQTEINQEFFETWKRKFLKSLCISYSKAPFYKNTMLLLESVFNENYSSISTLAMKSVQTFCDYLAVKTHMLVSSIDFPETNTLGRTERLISIIKALGGDTYINPIGGTELYKTNDFDAHDLQLLFLNTPPIIYPQFKNTFVPNLSIIDVLMFNSKENVMEMLNACNIN